MHGTFQGDLAFREGGVGMGQGDVSGPDSLGEEMLTKRLSCLKSQGKRGILKGGI